MGIGGAKGWRASLLAMISRKCRIIIIMKGQPTSQGAIGLPSVARRSVCSGYDTAAFKRIRVILRRPGVMAIYMYAYAALILSFESFKRLA